MTPPPESPVDVGNDQRPANRVEVGVYATAGLGFDHGLAVLALGYPFWLLPAGEGFRLMVETEAAGEVREELGRFERESAGWPPRPFAENVAPRRAEFVTPLLWALIVLGAFRAQATRPGWTEAGALDAVAVFNRGEWWRPLTALFLHADIGHLVSNTLSGIFVFSAVLSAIGRGRGWLLLALAAVIGNLAAAGVHWPEPYRSVGASTAVFAALGLLTGRAIRRILRHELRRRWRPVLVPLAAGLAVLGLFGAGDVHIDVVAHTTGFGAGLGLGFAAVDATQRD